MNNNRTAGEGDQENGGDDEQDLNARERAVANRETWIRMREQIVGEQRDSISDREEAVEHREQELRERAEAEAARREREHLLAQMREANERLVVAMLRADELVEEASEARASASEVASLEAEARRQAESAANQLRASEQALRVSASEAQANIRATDEFVAMLGHELRAPLAPILIALDLIAIDESDTHKREHTIIERQVKHLVRLVDDLLDVSRFRSGKIEVQRLPVELADVVARAVELAGPLVESKRHTLRVDVPRGLVVNGDMVRLAQAAANLLTNAAKYTPSGGTITVTGERRGDTVLLRVRDSGIGIAEEMLPRVFDMFAQERQALDRGPGGMGLGLAIVRSLVALHGGKVTAHSEGLGRGSELVIELPAAAARHAAPARDQNVDSIEVVGACRILVVEDNRDAATMLADALSALGHDVRVAFDGPSAISMVEEFVPEVALLDIGLPGMDGYEVATRLQAALAPHEVRFIALSGYAQPTDRRSSEAAGFDAHLVKPVNLATLERAIKDVRAHPH
jgi:signal transduction histidine kinase/ActR/RegA family two-component response regulator